MRRRRSAQTKCAAGANSHSPLKNIPRRASKPRQYVPKFQRIVNSQVHRRTIRAAHAYSKRFRVDRQSRPRPIAQPHRRLVIRRRRAIRRRYDFNHQIRNNGAVAADSNIQRQPFRRHISHIRLPHGIRVAFQQYAGIGTKSRRGRTYASRIAPMAAAISPCLKPAATVARSSPRISSPFTPQPCKRSSSSAVSSRGSVIVIAIPSISQLPTRPAVHAIGRTDKSSSNSSRRGANSWPPREDSRKVIAL